MVLFLFVIMLLDLRSSRARRALGPEAAASWASLLAAAFTGRRAPRAARGVAAIRRSPTASTAVLRLPAPAAAPSRRTRSRSPVAAGAPPAPVGRRARTRRRRAAAAAPSSGEAPGDGRGDRAYAGRVSPSAPERPMADARRDGLARRRRSRSLDRRRRTDARDRARGIAVAGGPVAASAPTARSSPARPAAVPGRRSTWSSSAGGLEPRAGGGPDGSPRGHRQGALRGLAAPVRGREPPADRAPSSAPSS